MIREQDALEYHASEPPGKLSITPTKPCLTQRDLSLAYSPGVAAPCLHIHRNKDDVYRYTGKSNLVAVISNGTAVLGLGDIGPLASKPVMEGKAILFKRFADIDVFDIELGSADPKEIIRACQLLEPTFGGINLEDIKAPECFEIERELKRTMGIPVFHDDQHGTAIISAAGLLNALELAGKHMDKARVVINGAGASALSCAEHYMRMGIRAENLLICDSKGVIYAGRKEGMNVFKEPFARETDRRTLTEAMIGADAFVGLSIANCITPEMLRGMAENPIVFALANPDPEIPYDDALAARPDAIVATGRSDYPNQVNNVLGFPAVFRGALDTRASAINEAMMLAATRALAELARSEAPESVCRIYGKERLVFGRDYILPKPFDPRVVVSEAVEVARAAMESGVAGITIDLNEYRERLDRRLGPTPVAAQFLIRQARSKPCRVAFADDHPSVMRACRALIDGQIARPLLIGDADNLRAGLREMSIEEHRVEIWDPATSDRLSSYVDELHKLRHRKGVTRGEAEMQVRNPNHFGAMMLRMNDADALISGMTANYSDAVRAILEIIPRKKNIERISGLYLMTTYHGKLFFLADCTVNVDPDSITLAEIARCTAQTARQLNVEPRVAFLSFSSYGSSRNLSSRKVARAVEQLRRSDPSIIADGEVQADVAVLPEIFGETYPFSTLSQAANVLIFPNLDSGNIAYKLLSAIGGAQVIGPILQGLEKPAHVLNRLASVNDIINLTAWAVVEAQERQRSLDAA